MRTIAFLTQKGGAGKTTLAASLAVAAASAGERVIVLDLDPQASLARWGKRREAENVPSKVMIEQLENERLPRLRAVLEGLNDAGFTLAVLDTAGADSVLAHTGSLKLSTSDVLPELVTVIWYSIVSPTLALIGPATYGPDAPSRSSLTTVIAGDGELETVETSLGSLHDVETVVPPPVYVATHW